MLENASQSPQTASLSSWRAWIEIVRIGGASLFIRSLSSWRAWIEIEMAEHDMKVATSLSSWRAWIEIIRLGAGGLM